MENIKDNKSSCHEGRICDELSDISEINIRNDTVFFMLIYFACIV